MDQIDAGFRNQRLRVDAREVRIGEEVFALDVIDRVACWSAARRTTGTYTDTTFWLKVAAGRRSATFYSDSGARDHLLESGRAWWTETRALLQRAVVPRLLAGAIGTIDGGGTVLIGGVGCTAADRRGLRTRYPFARPVPWHEIVDTVTERGVTQVVQRRGGSTRRTLRITMDQWNALLLPGLVERYRT